MYHWQICSFEYYISRLYITSLWRGTKSTNIYQNGSIRHTAIFFWDRIGRGIAFVLYRCLVNRRKRNSLGVSDISDTPLCNLYPNSSSEADFIFLRIGKRKTLSYKQKRIIRLPRTMITTVYNRIQWAYGRIIPLKFVNGRVSSF